MSSDRDGQSQLRVLHLSTYDLIGGAARAAYRLHRGLLSAGIASQMLVQRKSSDDPTVAVPDGFLSKRISLISLWLDRVLLNIYRKRGAGLFTVAGISGGLVSEINRFSPNLVHLHWLGGGTLRLESLAAVKKPLVWTLHDSWVFTGGCHVPATCNRYRQNCGKCPILKSSNTYDLSNWIWRRKRNAWKNLNLTLVAPSRWLGDCAKSSSLFGKNVRVEVIPIGIDTNRYKPWDKATARRLLSLPLNKKLLLFGAVNPLKDTNKGFGLLVKALHALANEAQSDQLELVIFGTSSPNDKFDFGMPATYLGVIHDDISLSLAYSAADVMIVPSLQEAFSQTALEAQSCGIPVVAFNATGLRDIVQHKQTGYLAEPYSTNDLAKGIAWVLEDSERWSRLSLQARNRVELQFRIDLVAERYRKLYFELLNESKNSVAKTVTL